MTIRFTLIAVWLLIWSLSPCKAAPESEAAHVEYDRQLDVVYGYKDGMGLIMDVLTPRQNQNGAGILVIHSGGLISNPTAYRDDGWQKRRPVIADLLRRGYVLFVAKHASAPKYSLPEIRMDMPRAVRFIRHHASRFGIDANRIGAIGGSSGGLLALLLATKAPVPESGRSDEIERESSKVQAVVAYFPVTDFVNWGNKTILDGLNEEQQKAMNLECSPITYVSKDTTPSLLLHGDQDETVPLEQSSIFQERMQEAGAVCELIVATGKGHGWRTPIENESRAVTEWFDKWLIASRAMEETTLRSSGSALVADKASFTNSIGMKFVPVLGASVLFSVWETRVQDFEVFVNETGHDALQGMRSLGKGLWKKRGHTWREPGFPQTPRHPVVGVDWNDARAFCRWLSRKEGRTYRLPSDKEWSIAVGLPVDHDERPEERGRNAQAMYPWGFSFPPPADAGNYAGAEADEDEYWPLEWKGMVIKGFRDGFAQTAPVGSFKPNKYGLYDMGGNVWEWCGDNPKPTNDTSRILRGGGWIDSSDGAEPANKNLMLSSFRNARPPFWRYDAAGFRVVAESE